MASLLVIRGHDQGKRFELTSPHETLGRDHANSIQLHDTEISRRHLELKRQDSGHLVVDLQSSNGTFVNNRRVERQALSNGDRLQVGRTLMIYSASDPAAKAPPSPKVNIVTGEGGGRESRIVSSLSEAEGSQIFSGEQFSSRDAESSWLNRARSNLQVMYRTALTVSHTLNIDELLQRILDLIFEWVAADRGCIMLIDHESQELQPAVRRDRQGEGEGSLTISRTILDYVMQRNEGVRTSDAVGDQRWEAGVSIVRQGVREAICVPMQGRYGVVGAIYIDTYTASGEPLRPQTNQFSDEHLKLMVAIGHQAALAIEDTSYYSAMLQAERLAAMGQTIATLSHHIKNILQGIRGGSFLIQEGLKSDDNDVVRKGWGIVEKNQEKISSLVMDMLTYSKEREPDMAPGDLNAVVADVVELMQSRAAEAGVSLDWIPLPSMPEVQFDSDAMHRAVLNVVTNAIDACEKQEEGRVEVRTQMDADASHCQVLVRDNGVGIEPDEWKKIFSVFESRKGSRGTGLGLPVSQKILREHGGDITVESTPGQGSCFTLAFPAIAAESATSENDGGLTREL
jgi:two-component system, NtrC family, sensor kinase